MAYVKNLIDQQYGNVKWKFYDNIIKRLRCRKEEQYTQLLPCEDVIIDTPIFACKFAQQKNNENFLALANEDGKLAIHDTTNNEERYGVRAHNNAIFDLAWMFENMKIVTASGDHSARLFDVTNNDIRELQVFTGHTRSVKTVTFRKDDPSVFATGGRDGNIILWDTRSNISNLIGKADRTIYNSHQVKTPKRSRRKILGTSLSPHTAALIGAKSVTGLVFRNDDTLISCGAGDGVIKIWDLRKNYSIYKSEPLPKGRIPYIGSTTKNGFSSLIIDKDCLKLYANCLDNTIYSYNLNSLNPQPIMKYIGHQNSTFYVKSSLSRDGLYLISGSSDENAYIWNINSSKPFVKLSGHSAEVTCVAWCEIDDITIVTCSDDMTHKIWRIGNEELPENWEIDGRGQAELLPLNDQIHSKLKRHNHYNDENNGTPKKLIIGCNKCDTPSSNNLCQNCTQFTNKRKLSSVNEIIEINTKRSRNELFEPRKLFCNLQETNQSSSSSSSSSPTVNLPNYVIDGVAPHLNYSPPKKKSYDWLTKMRIERKLRNDFIDASNNQQLSSSSSSSSPPPAKMAKFEQQTNQQRRCSSPQSPILRFFKIKCDGHSSANNNCNSNNKRTTQNLIVNSSKATQ